ncbi:MAG TPA: agglutinin biogenesis protein MshP [Noviherbaspirillum sp.]|jgi:MSHA biogenesis protein MshP|uniref:pilus assembly PilX family protein n=1 Tax=Noviherbaspirillum sp. TaxID=1926288 RepID=UPI002F954159
MKNRPGCNPQSGFSLISAIFLLVVLAVLGAAIVQVSTAQHIGSALDLQGARAYQAARAGIEWGLFRELEQNACPGAPASFQPPATTDLGQFTVTVTCIRTATAVPGVVRRRIQSVACNAPQAGEPRCRPNQPGGPDYVQRTVQVDF